MRRIVAESSANKMTSTSLSVVFAPTLVEHDPAAALQTAPSSCSGDPISITGSQGSVMDLQRLTYDDAASSYPKSYVRNQSRNEDVRDICTGPNNIPVESDCLAKTNESLKGSEICEVIESASEGQWGDNATKPVYNMLSPIFAAAGGSGDGGSSAGVVHPTTSLISSTSTIINAITRGANNDCSNTAATLPLRAANNKDTLEEAGHHTSTLADETTPLVTSYVTQSIADHVACSPVHDKVSPLMARSTKPMIGSPYNGFLNPCYQSNMSLSTSVSPHPHLKPDHLLCMKFAALEPKVLELLIDKHRQIMTIE